jgi:hypothetical protein
VLREKKHVQRKQDGKKRKSNKENAIDKKKSELHCENLQTKKKKCKTSKAKEL